MRDVGRLYSDYNCVTATRRWGHWIPPTIKESCPVYSLVIGSALFTAGFVASRRQPRIARAFVCFSVIFAMAPSRLNCTIALFEQDFVGCAVAEAFAGAVVE